MFCICFVYGEYMVEIWWRYGGDMGQYKEVGESMHNIDRQMRILQMNGVLDRCKGIILGELKSF